MHDAASTATGILWYKAVPCETLLICTWFMGCTDDSGYSASTVYATSSRAFIAFDGKASMNRMNCVRAQRLNWHILSVHDATTKLFSKKTCCVKQMETDLFARWKKVKKNHWKKKGVSHGNIDRRPVTAMPKDSASVKKRFKSTDELELQDEIGEG